MLQWQLFQKLKQVVEQGFSKPFGIPIFKILLTVEKSNLYFKYVSICTICSLFNNIYKIINEQNILESKVAIAAPLTDIFKIKIKK